MRRAQRARSDASNSADPYERRRRRLLPLGRALLESAASPPAAPPTPHAKVAEAVKSCLYWSMVMFVGSFGFSTALAMLSKVEVFTVTTCLSSFDLVQPLSVIMASSSLAVMFRSSMSCSCLIDRNVEETTPAMKLRTAACQPLAFDKASTLSASFQKALNFAISSCWASPLMPENSLLYFSGIWYMQRQKSLFGKAMSAFRRMPSMISWLLSSG
mmetsp:Transcript_70116/g.183769  ORF Transcript_70116/g.183769 Transcript_70116/m.183769 type:complete len:215 (-) Transcript_70116:239-883(-)